MEKTAQVPSPAPETNTELSDLVCRQEIIVVMNEGAVRLQGKADETFLVRGDTQINGVALGAYSGPIFKEEIPPDASAIVLGSNHYIPLSERAADGEDHSRIASAYRHITCDALERLIGKHHLDYFYSIPRENIMRMIKQ